MGRTPAFFATVRSITLRDPLAEFLGAVAGGRIEYSYLDAVKLTGHSRKAFGKAWQARTAAMLFP